jgi:hypothetical protein
MEYLNSTPFEFYITQFGLMFTVVVFGGVLLRWPLHRHEIGGYLLAGSIGWLIGFIIATLPYLYVTAQEHVISPILIGSHFSEWPPSWWPGWLPWFGPFDGFIIGSVVGFGAGCYVFYRRHRKLAV